MTVHNKLVRDKIPAIIVSKGQKAVTKTLSDADYVESLRQKLLEEVNEFLADNNTEELADILEVIHALGRTLEAEPADLEALRLQKADERGK